MAVHEQTDPYTHAHIYIATYLYTIFNQYIDNYTHRLISVYLQSYMHRHTFFSTLVCAATEIWGFVNTDYEKRYTTYDYKMGQMMIFFSSDRQSNIYKTPTQI